MSAWTDAADWCVRVPATGAYQVRRPLAWEVGTKGSGLFVSLPIGTLFDVSVPGWMERVCDPHEPRFLKAAALHDELLRRGWDRVTAGAVFHNALKADGVGRRRRLGMWLAVSVWRWS